MAQCLCSVVWLHVGIGCLGGEAGLIRRYCQSEQPQFPELGQLFLRSPQSPAGKRLRIAWPGGNISWSSSDFQNYLVNPLLNMLAARQLTNQIDYVVLSMDIRSKPSMRMLSQSMARLGFCFMG